jgi:hypothetical protein
MRITIVPIVEGHGEVEAVPILIRRIAQELNPEIVLDIPRPIRIPSTKLIREGEIERAIELALSKIEGKGGILVLNDCDSHSCCPAIDGPNLLARASGYRPNLMISVVLANKEYEAWFIASSSSIEGKRGLSASLPIEDDPESIRGAKEWLTNHKTDGHPYTEVTDQPALTDIFNISDAKRANSFDKFYREIARMIETLSSEGNE